MKSVLYALMVAFVLAGCSRQDPIERLMIRLQTESIISYSFNPVELPATATPEEVIAALSKRRGGELGHFDFSSYKISEVRPVQAPILKKCTAVLLDTNLGQKIVLLRPFGADTNWAGWYYRIYDAK